MGSYGDTLILAPLAALIQSTGDEQSPDLGVRGLPDEQMQTRLPQSAPHRRRVFLDRDDSERSARACLGRISTTDALQAAWCDDE
jgi:hypothetical protein